MPKGLFQNFVGKAKAAIVTSNDSSKRGQVSSYVPQTFYSIRFLPLPACPSLLESLPLAFTLIGLFCLRVCTVKNIMVGSHAYFSSLRIHHRRHIAAFFLSHKIQKYYGGITCILFQSEDPSPTPYRCFFSFSRLIKT